MARISLKAKNPFGQDIEVLSLKTWIGLGAFAVVLAGLGIMVRFFTQQSKTLINPIESAWAKINKGG